MEQLTNTKALLDGTRPSETPVRDVGILPIKSDPARAWLRLNEVSIPSLAPVKTKVTPNAAAAFDLLRSRVLRQARKDGIRRLAITSPTPGCGATTVTAALALSLARQIDLKIMVFDLNLRSPGLSAEFALSESVSRVSALGRVRREFDSSALRIGHNLALSLITDPEPDPAELLGTVRSKEFLKQIEHEFEPDLILIDLPPVLPHDDFVAAADLFDAALMIARADHSTVDQIDRAERLMSEQKPCLGVVMNACRFSNHPELGTQD
ncbi:exopolysaccharide biosynthesis protein [uncultured Litoreibacter sp.]|uniref:exopolysaccharide biosynthesis protein n=1 Tax=uncultured Litoreibacter sp. TaxID=1392394 RepID=UPI0026297655|nr:exopolysaccharide biosynthesis protein [uncultured Litoreibacter sp.]